MIRKRFYFIHQQLNFIFYTQMNQQQHQIDIGEARLSQPLQDGQILNITNQTKILEITTNIREKELQNLVDQQKQKVINAQKKYQELTEFEDQHKVSLLSQITVLEDKIQSLAQSHQRQVLIYCQQIQNLKMLNEQLTKSQEQLQTSLKSIQEIFNLSNILKTLGQQGLLQISNYLEVYRRYQQKKDQSQQLNKQNQRLVPQHFIAFKEYFQNQKMVETLLESLKQHNEQNIKRNVEMQLEIGIRLSQIYQKSQQLNAVKDQSNEQINQLRQQIANLQIQLKNCEESKFQLQEVQTKCQTYTDIIGQLKARLEQKQIQMEQLATEYEQKILSVYNQNRQLHIQVSKALNNCQQQTNNYKSIIIGLQNNLIQKQQAIVNLEKINKNLQDISKKSKAQLQKCAIQLKKAKQASQFEENQRKLNEQLFQIRLQGLSQEISLLNQKLHIEASLHSHSDTEQNTSHAKRYQSSNQNKSRKQSVNICPKSLLIDMDDKFEDQRWDYPNQTNIQHYKIEVNWAQLYYNLLKRHNEFSKKVHSKLSKITKKCK